MPGRQADLRGGRTVSLASTGIQQALRRGPLARPSARRECLFDWHWLPSCSQRPSSRQAASCADTIAHLADQVAGALAPPTQLRGQGPGRTPAEASAIIAPFLVAPKLNRSTPARQVRLAGETSRRGHGVGKARTIHVHPHARTPAPHRHKALYLIGPVNRAELGRLAEAESAAGSTLVIAQVAGGLQRLALRACGCPSLALASPSRSISFAHRR